VLQQVRQSARTPPPEPQADTSALRRRFARWVSDDRCESVLRWCEWVDAVLAGPGPPEVLVHGDLHGHNQVWDLQAPALRAVVDFDITGP
jgi:aminoglycoside phosphotransferase (APT) family kinase protein